MADKIWNKYWGTYSFVHTDMCNLKVQVQLVSRKKHDSKAGVRSVFNAVSTIY